MLDLALLQNQVFFNWSKLIEQSLINGHVHFD